MSRSTLSRRSTISALALGAVAIALASAPVSAQQTPSGAAAERPVSNSLKPQTGAMTSSTPRTPTERGAGIDGQGAMGAAPASGGLAKGNFTANNNK